MCDQMNGSELAEVVTEQQILCEKEECHSVHSGGKSFWIRASMMATITFVVGITIGVYAAKLSADTTPAPAASDNIAEDIQDKYAVVPEGQQIMPAHHPSSWVSSAPIGNVHARTQHSMTVIEFLHTPKFLHRFTDQVVRLHSGFNIGSLGQNMKIYTSAHDAAAHHAAAREQIDEFFGDLAKKHPKMAMFLNGMKLDQSQQEAFHNIVDHLTDHRTINAGIEATIATVEGLPEGKEGIKRHLQQQMGKDLEPLKRLKAEIFPAHFDAEKENDLESRAIQEDEPDSNDGHMLILQHAASKADVQSLRDLQKHWDTNQVQVPKGRRLMGTMAILGIIKAVLANIVSQILGWIVPGNVAKYIGLGITGLADVYSCVQWGMGPNNWIGCVIDLIGTVLGVLNMFVPGLR